MKRWQRDHNALQAVTHKRESAVGLWNLDNVGSRDKEHCAVCEWNAVLHPTNLRYKIELQVVSREAPFVYQTTHHITWLHA